MIDPAQRPFPIGKLSKATGVKVPTIRFYEQAGLLPVPDRSDSDRRLYDDAAVRRLSFIRHARQLGFDLDAIRSLLDLSDHPDRPCAEANALAERHLAAVRSRIDQLQRLEMELTRLSAECAGGRVSDCRVIEVLHDHALCGAANTHA
ncbi:MerR family DNA-binding protein [Brevundimonas aurantiaca]|jgi:DNA-binding transcriptional MerR regulator|uniref:MerR family DNA-binding protein n=1 Tax=Brevundimonas aurantiaca TaxID=74316 RepID=UPI001601E317|nr:transcriptional regulator [Pseudomonas sp. FW305-3-2-15-E-TSA4]